MKVLSHPNPALATAACEVDPAADATLTGLVKRMAKTMYDAPGIGLAATQIGVLKRVVVYDLSDDGTGLAAVCNPCIVESSDECETEEEGCLSLPGVTVLVSRACRVVCEGLALTGKPVRIEAEGLYARMLQHECDHLDGKLILDRATPEERKAALKRYREACAESGSDL